MPGIFKHHCITVNKGSVGIICGNSKLVGDAFSLLAIYIIAQFYCITAPVRWIDRKQSIWISSCSRGDQSMPIVGRWRNGDIYYVPDTLRKCVSGITFPVREGAVFKSDIRWAGMVLGS